MKHAFVSPISIPSHRVKRNACQRRPAIVANANEQSGASWQNTPNYQTLGTGMQAKGIQTIEFSIRPNGIIEEKVTGVRGKNCQKLTEKIEKALGTVSKRTLKETVTTSSILGLELKDIPRVFFSPSYQSEGTPASGKELPDVFSEQTMHVASRR
ncbi:hypothetical protein FGB62_64g146 [Gracilaria domingensis]|nr:hypothetical protein FGB62_64g146 [Gracilaria domingensis]